jgi:two-component system sensor histidine kinase KdpD
MLYSESFNNQAKIRKTGAILAIIVSMHSYPEAPSIDPETALARLTNDRQKAFPEFPRGILRISMAPLWRQYVLAFAVFLVVSLVNLVLLHWIGYQAIALVYLLAIVLLALFVSRGPIIFGTALTAAGWNFFFAPPVFAFNVWDTYDNMMLITYFVVTSIVGYLTAHLRAQRDAELKSKLIAESERLGRVLLNSVSHELRTPISTITSIAQNWHGISDISEQQKLMVELESASARLNRVVQSLLSAARIQSGRLQPKLDWCDVSELIHIALRGVKVETSHHPVDTVIPDNLPLIRADAILTEQALANLIVNAAVHTPPGAPIEVSAQIEAGTLVLAVADRGPGLPPELPERIFDPFHRGPEAKTGGVGLGLAIVKGFIEAQGGRVKAANRPNGGAIFTIYLAAADDAPKPPEELL